MKGERIAEEQKNIKIYPRSLPTIAARDEELNGILQQNEKQHCSQFYIRDV